MRYFLFIKYNYQFNVHHFQTGYLLQGEKLGNFMEEGIIIPQRKIDGHVKSRHPGDRVPP